MPSYSSDIVTGNKSLAVTPADTDLPAGPCRALWVGTAGNITVEFPDGTVAIAMPALVGLFPFKCKQVRSDTTAENIWAIY